MAFEVRTSPNAEQDILRILDWLIGLQAGETGQRWFQKLNEAIGSLAEMPLRCKLAPESNCFPFEVRELFYGRRPHVYRILFTVDGNIVYLLRVRHGRRLPVGPN